MRSCRRGESLCGGFFVLARSVFSSTSLGFVATNRLRASPKLKSSLSGGSSLFSGEKIIHARRNFISCRLNRQKKRLAARVIGRTAWPREIKRSKTVSPKTPLAPLAFVASARALSRRGIPHERHPANTGGNLLAQGCADSS